MVAIALRQSKSTGNRSASVAEDFGARSRGAEIEKWEEAGGGVLDLVLGGEGSPEARGKRGRVFGGFSRLSERIKDFLDDSPEWSSRNPGRERLAAGLLGGQSLLARGRDRVIPLYTFYTFFLHQTAFHGF